MLDASYQTHGTASLKVKYWARLLTRLVVVSAVVERPSGFATTFAVVPYEVDAVMEINVLFFKNHVACKIYSLWEISLYSYQTFPKHAAIYASMF